MSTTGGGSEGGRGRDNGKGGGLSSRNVARTDAKDSSLLSGVCADQSRLVRSELGGALLLALGVLVGLALDGLDVDAIGGYDLETAD